MISHNNFKRFLEEKIKNTEKSIDANEMRVSNNLIEVYQAQFTVPSSTSIIQGSNTSSAKFGNTNNNSYNPFPHFPEQKNLIIDEKTAKINEYKKKYDHCIERFKNLTENSINSNLSANLSFKKNIQNGPPDSYVTQNLQRSIKDVIPEADLNPSFAEEQVLMI
jgi:translation initiation factor 2 beta subunit (eIF-2beta)/eIF-5